MMKYVRGKLNGTRQVIIFTGNVLNHSDVAKFLDEATSAGFVEVRDKEIKCFGESNTLNLPSDNKDALFIKAFLGIEE